MNHNGGQTPHDIVKRSGKASERSGENQKVEKSKKEPLREVQQRWQLFFENAPVYCYIISPTGYILDVNASALAALGYSKDELLGRKLNELYAPEEDRKMKQLLANWREEGDLNDREITILTKERERRSVLLSASTVKDPDGEPLYSIFIQRDITEYKRKSEALRESKSQLEDASNRYQSIFENVPIGLAHVDLDGHIFECNRALEKMLGYSREELRGINISNLTHPDDWEVEKFLDREILEGRRESYEIEKRFTHKDGHIIWGRLRVSVSRDKKGKPEFIIGMAEDITERLQEEKRHITLFETMAQGVVYQDSEGKIISANPAAEWILGLSFPQMTGRESIDPRWRAIHEDGSDFPGEDHPAMVSLKTGKPTKNVVMGVFNPMRDEHIWINVNAIPLFRPGEDTPYQVYTTFSDITERMRHESQRAQQQGELELYASLLRHDLGNDLQIILGNIDFAEMLMVGNNGEAGKRLSSVRAAAMRMGDLLKALETEGDFEDGTLTELLERSAASAMEIHSGLTVNVQVSDEARAVALTRYRLLSIVCENLYRNAAEHAGPDAIVNVNLSLSGTNAIIEISDDGPGVPENLRPKLFERGVTTNGGGLGLYLSRQLLNVYNGSIELLAPREGEGSRFLITIPIRT